MKPYPFVRLGRAAITTSIVANVCGVASGTACGTHNSVVFAIALSETLSVTCDFVAILPLFGNVLLTVLLAPNFVSIFFNMYSLQREERSVKELRYLIVFSLFLMHFTNAYQFWSLLPY